MCVHEEEGVGVCARGGRSGCVCTRRKEWVCVHEEEGVCVCARGGRSGCVCTRRKEWVCVHACVILREK